MEDSFLETVRGMAAEAKPSEGGDNGGDKKDPPAEPNGNTDPPLEGGKPPEQKETPAPTINWKELGEEYDSFETIKQKLPEKIKRLSEVEKELEEWKNKGPQKPEYADPDVESYDSWVRNTGNKSYEAYKIAKNATSIADGIDVLVAKALYENPEFKGFEEKIKDQLIEQYNIDPKTVDEDTIRFNMIKLNKDSKDAKEFFTGLQGKMQGSQIDQEAINKEKTEKQAAHQANVSKIVEGVVKGFTKIPIPTIGADGKTTEIIEDFEVEGLDSYQKWLVDSFAGMPDVKPEHVQYELRKQYAWDNLPKIMAKALKNQRTKLEAEYEEKYQGGMERKPPGGGSDGSGLDQVDVMLQKYNQSR